MKESKQNIFLSDITRVTKLLELTLKILSVIASLALIFGGYFLYTFLQRIGKLEYFIELLNNYSLLFTSCLFAFLILFLFFIFIISPLPWFHTLRYDFPKESSAKSFLWFSAIIILSPILYFLGFISDNNHPTISEILLWSAVFLPTTLYFFYCIKKYLCHIKNIEDNGIKIKRNLLKKFLSKFSNIIFLYFVASFVLGSLLPLTVFSFASKNNSSELKIFSSVFIVYVIITIEMLLLSVSLKIKSKIINYQQIVSALFLLSIALILLLSSVIGKNFLYNIFSNVGLTQTQNRLHFI